MDERVFDAMLKTALEESLRQDLEAWEDSPPVKQSRRQRRRMKQMLADPNGYCRRWEEQRQGAAGQEARMDGGAPVRRRFGRYAAVAVVAALLAGTAAAYTLTGGAFFRQMFEKSDWADLYGNAADTEQLLGMGGGNVGAVIEDEDLRFEILDVVSDEQFAMVSVRCTILRHELVDGLEAPYEAGRVRFLNTDITGEDGIGPTSYGVSFTLPETWEELGPYQYGLIFSFSNDGVPLSGKYNIVLQDLGAYSDMETKALLNKAWTLEVTLPATGAEPHQLDLPCTIAGKPGVLEKLSLSPLALSMEFQMPEDVGFKGFDEFSKTLICMRDGGIIDSGGYMCGVSGGGGSARVTLEFQMPLDLSQVESIQVCGGEVLMEDLQA